MSTDHHTVLITGGTRGIGRAVALHVAKQYGGTVIMSYLQRHDDAHDAARAVTAAGARPVLIQANLAFPDDVERLCGSVREHTNALHGIVHCAATTNFKRPLDLQPRHLDAIVHMNVTSFLDVVRELAGLLTAGASIVALSSMGSQRVVPNYAAMGVAKAALESLVRYLASDMAPSGVRVNAVAAGLVVTGSTQSMPDHERLVDEVVRHTPLGRLGTAADVADVVGFLLSDASAWITGQVITADGGLTLA
jgi:NAD(P)-dependent dehydrogenase (short-subunit alcohol dehydrogenase family)